MAKTERRTKSVEVDAEGKKTVVIEVTVIETTGQRWDLASITGQRVVLALERDRLLQDVARLDAHDAELAEIEALLTT